MSTPLFGVDAFADRPFGGNPAAVCLLEQPADAEWMADVAREMNLSETAFLHPDADGYNLRWFTPGMEVDLCGHATLASAHVLWETGRLDANAEARFHTRSGLLTARRSGNLIEMDFPSQAVTPCSAPAGLLEAIGTKGRCVGRNDTDYLVEVATESDVRAARPNFLKLGEVKARGIIVTAPADGGEFDFVSRFFAPAAGVNEDPVTGSAHCALAPFWAERFGRTDLRGYQASRRGGVVSVRVAGDRVKLAGPAVTVWRGELLRSSAESLLP